MPNLPRKNQRRVLHKSHFLLSTNVISTKKRPLKVAFLLVVSMMPGESVEKLKRATTQFFPTVHNGAE